MELQKPRCWETASALSCTDEAIPPSRRDQEGRLGRYISPETAQAMTEKARATPRWIGSDETAQCQLCTTAFNKVTNPKHHCRRCGFAVCGSCSQHRHNLNRWLEDQKPHELRETRSIEALRVCTGCNAHITDEIQWYKQLRPHHESLRPTFLVAVDGPAVSVGTTTPAALGAPTAISVERFVQAHMQDAIAGANAGASTQEQSEPEPETGAAGTTRACDTG